MRQRNRLIELGTFGTIPINTHAGLTAPQQGG
jgi:hypothetical protein